MTKQEPYIEEILGQFREEFVKKPLKESETFGWSKQDCGGAEMIVNWLRKTLLKYGSKREQKGFDMAVDYIEKIIELAGGVVPINIEKVLKEAREESL